MCDLVVQFTFVTNVAINVTNLWHTDVTYHRVIPHLPITGLYHTYSSQAGDNYIMKVVLLIKVVALVMALYHYIKGNTSIIYNQVKDFNWNNYQKYPCNNQIHLYTSVYISLITCSIITSEFKSSKRLSLLW